MEEKKKLGEILLEAGVIDKFQLKSALAEQNKWGGRLGNHLVQMGILTEDLLVKALSKQLKIPNLDLAQMMVTPDVLELVPHEIAEKFHLVPVAVKKIANKRTLIVAMSDPTNLDAVDELQFRTGHIIKPAVAGDTAIELAIRRYYYGELGPQRVVGQPIEFDASRPAHRAPEVTNVPSSGVPVPPENTFSLGEDEPAPVAAPIAPVAAVVPPVAEPEIAEASLADLGVEAEPTHADPVYPPTSDSGAWPPAETAAPAWPAGETAAEAPAWAAPEANVAEPEPYYDPNAPTAPNVAADPAYDAAAEPPAWGADPSAAEPSGDAPVLEPTYADAPMESLEPEPLAPEAIEPAAYPEPEPAYAEAVAETAPVADDPTAAPAWSSPDSAVEAPYPHDEPTVAADDVEPPAWTPPAEAAPVTEVWPEPAPVTEAWAEPAPAENVPAIADAPAVTDEIWPEAAAATEEPPVAQLDPTEPPELSLSLSEPSVEPSVLEPTNAPEISMDGVLEPAEPGPVEAAVAEMDAVPASFSPGDAVQTFLGQHDGPYEPTTPGEPTNAPDDTMPEAMAADGGRPMVMSSANGGSWTEESRVADVEPEEPYADPMNGSAAAETQGGYTVPPDPLGGIPFDTAEGRAIRALCALLLEKGVLTADELASRLRTAIEGMGGGEGNA